MKKFSIRTSRLLAGAAVAAAALFAACTADTEDEPVAAVPLRFSVSMPESWNTPDAARSAADKALPTRSDFTGNSFGVFAYVKGSTSEESPILYMNNVEVIKHMAGDDIYYAPKENYYLRGGMETIFFAYSPYDADVKNSITCDVVNHNTNWLTAVASSTTDKVDGGIALAFSHACASVTLTSHNDNYLSNTIALSDVFTTGTLAPAPAKSTWEWTTSSSSKDVPIFENQSLSKQYYMIPQELNTPKATMANTGTWELMEGTDAPQKWEKNKAYTYYFDGP